MSDRIEEMMDNSPEWKFREVDEGELEDFFKMSGYSKRISKQFLLRGIRSEEDLYHFLNDDIISLQNPFQFTHMLSAVARTKKAVYNGEKIFIFGDRDVDGVLSTAMLFNMLKRFDADVLCRVPEGEYGYGIEKKDVDFSKNKNVSLIITVDTGISSCKEIAYAHSLGIDTIIMDHHTQPDTIPENTLIINPKMSFEKYPFKDLSAGGVVLKFIHAFILSYTKNFNRVFVPLISDGEHIQGIKVRNGLAREHINIEESIHYPIKNNYMIVTDAHKTLPKYFTSWLKDNKIDQLSIVISQPYNSIEEFAAIFTRLFAKKQKKTIDFVRSFIDLSALSTISDIMPLVGENRIIVKEGLQQIPKTLNLGLKVLLGYCDLPDFPLTARHIAWNVAPVINAAGRMGDAKIAVKLFTTEDVCTANDLSRILIEFNERRKEKGERNLSIIRPMVENTYSKDPVIVLSTDQAEHGVTGILASKIARKYSKTAIIIVNDGNIGIGSGRGSGNIDLVSLVSRCDDLLIKYGGHRSAVGFTIATRNIESFRKRINSIVHNELDSYKCKDILEIDDTISPDEISFDFYYDFRVFEPTGTGNLPPRFSILGTTVTSPCSIGKNKSHIKFYIPGRDCMVPVIGWGLADKASKILSENSLIDIVFTVEEDHFRGESSLQLILIDIRRAA